MTSATRSSATRRRNRATSNSVDHLNNVNKPQTSRTLRRPTRIQTNTPAVHSQSDDVWNVPESPEVTQSRFQALSQSVPQLTPRRSARLHQISPNGSTPTRKSTRLADRSAQTIAERDPSSSPSRIQETQDLQPVSAMSQEHSGSTPSSSQFQTPEPAMRQRPDDLPSSASHGLAPSVVITVPQSPEIPRNQRKRAKHNRKSTDAMTQTTNTTETRETEKPSTEAETAEAETAEAEMAEAETGEAETGEARSDSSSSPSESSRCSSRKPESYPASPSSTRSSPDLPAQHSSPIAPSRKRCRDESDELKAMRLGGQEANWRVLIDIRRMEDNILPSWSRHFEGIKGLVDMASAEYQEAIKHHTVQHGVPERPLRQCLNHIRQIEEKADNRIDHIYRQSTKSDPSPRLGEMLDDFEGRVIAPIVRLILLPCFQLYHQTYGRSVLARDNFTEVIRLLRHLCDAAYSLTVDNHVHGMNPSAALRRPLRELGIALENGELELKEWSDAEQKALLKGLRRYRDHDRYLRIRRKYREQLSRRTTEEIRARAKLIYERLMPTIEDKIQTPQGRRQWQWLLSVADDRE